MFPHYDMVITTHFGLGKSFTFPTEISSKEELDTAVELMKKIASFSGETALGSIVIFSEEVLKTCIIEFIK